MTHVLAYEYFEGFLPFRNIHVEDVHIDHFDKIVSRALIWNQQDDPSGHLITSVYVICRQYTNATLWIYISVNRIRIISIYSIRIWLLLILSVRRNKIMRPFLMYVYAWCQFPYRQQTLRRNKEEYIKYDLKIHWEIYLRRWATQNGMYSSLIYLLRLLNLFNDIVNQHHYFLSIKMPY
jgi:hypothetical protein